MYFCNIWTLSSLCLQLRHPCQRPNLRPLILLQDLEIWVLLYQVKMFSPIWSYVLVLYCADFNILYLIFFTFFFAGSSSSNFSGPSLSTKTPSSSTPSSKPQAQAWQAGKPNSAQSKPWMSGSGSTPKGSSTPQPAGAPPTKPNYNLNFSSVIGGREERGVRGPGFGKRSSVWTFGYCGWNVYFFSIVFIVVIH